MSAFKKASATKSSMNARGAFLKMRNGDTKVAMIVMPGDVITYYKHDTWGTGKQVHHVCLDFDGTGTPCPGCAAGIPRVRKYAIPVVVEGGDTKILETGVKIFEQLKKAAATEPNEFIGRWFNINRSGSGRGTKYEVTAMMSKLSQVPDTYPDISKLLISDLDKIEALYNSADDDIDL